MTKMSAKHINTIKQWPVPQVPNICRPEVETTADVSKLRSSEQRTWQIKTKYADQGCEDEHVEVNHSSELVHGEIHSAEIVLQ